MMLAAGQGTSVLVEAKGDDADEAVAAIARLVADRFGESE
jgi:phosphocarrier protein